MFSYSAHLKILDVQLQCTSMRAKKKKKFIRLVNKIIKSLPLISITLSSLSQSLSHLISSLKTLSSKLLFRRRSPHLISSHAADRLLIKLPIWSSSKPPVWNPWSLPTHSFCRPSSPTLCLFVIGDFVWFGLRKKIRDLRFFFFLDVDCECWCWLWL